MKNKPCNKIVIDQLTIFDPYPTELKIVNDDCVGFRSLCALGVYGMDHLRERIGYKEIRVKAPSSSSNRSPWFINVPSVKHRNTRGYLWVSNHFTSSWMGNARCLRKFPTRPGIEPHTSGLIVKRFS